MDQLLTIGEVATRLRFSEKRIRQLIDLGVLKSHQVIRPGGRHLIRASDVERLLEREDDHAAVR
jgi:excisionase family DNA binding protein